MKTTKEFARHILFGATAWWLAMAQASLAADRESSADKQRKLIAVLQSDAPPQEKAIPCKQLAIYGNKDAVPALAPLPNITRLLCDSEVSGPMMTGTGFSST